MYKSKPKLLSPSLCYPSCSLRSLARSLSGLLYDFLRLPEYTNKIISCIAEYVTQHFNPRRSWPRRTVQAGGKKRTSLSWLERGTAARQASSPSLSLPPSLSLSSQNQNPSNPEHQVYPLKEKSAIFCSPRAHTHTRIFTALCDRQRASSQRTFPSCGCASALSMAASAFELSAKEKKRRAKKRKRRVREDQSVKKLNETLKSLPDTLRQWGGTKGKASRLRKRK